MRPQPAAIIPVNTAWASAKGASLDDVIAAAGVSKSQLYHYFADKDDLVRAVIARQTARVFAEHGRDEHGHAHHDARL